MIEWKGFKELCRVLESRFKVPSGATVRRDVMVCLNLRKKKVEELLQGKQSESLSHQYMELTPKDGLYGCQCMPYLLIFL